MSLLRNADAVPSAEVCCKQSMDLIMEEGANYTLGTLLRCS
jgi:hypothetical protein